MSIYTVNEIENGTAGGTNVDLSEYALKSEVSTIIDLDGLNNTIDKLTTAIANKLDKSPEHTHSITAVNDLTNQLDDKLSKSTTYSLNSVIDTTSSGTLNELTLSNSLKINKDSKTLKIYIEDNNINFAYGDTVFMYYDTTASTVFVKGVALDQFITNTNATLQNHYDAINIIAEKLDLLEDTGGSTSGGNTGDTSGGIDTSGLEYVSYKEHSSSNDPCYPHLMIHVI